MALGPESLLTSDEARLAAAEAVVDNAIVNAKSRPVRVSATLLPSVSGNDLHSALMMRYFLAGWGGAMWVHDYRDGDYLELK